MQLFRAAHEAGDARKGDAEYQDGDRTVTRRSRERRHGTGEAALRTQIKADLASLLSTIRLEAVQPLDDAPYVQKSIINYGFRDLSSVSMTDLTTSRIADSIRQSLIDHEPRLVPETLDIQLNDKYGDKQQRLTFSINAEIVANPVDIALDFLAEVDIGAGKVQMADKRGGT